MPMTIGIDPHKHSHTAAVLDERGQLLARHRVRVGPDSHRELCRWAKRWPDRRWAIEGVSGCGRALAQALASDGEPVVDVPAKLTAQVRLLASGHGRKNDPADAVWTAVAALHAPALPQVRPEDHTTVLRLLSERRDDLVRERTRTTNRLHGLLDDLAPGQAGRNLRADTAAALLRRLRPVGGPNLTRRQLARELLVERPAASARACNPTRICRQVPSRCQRRNKP
jgi:transposase